MPRKTSKFPNGRRGDAVHVLSKSRGKRAGQRLWDSRTAPRISLRELTMPDSAEALVRPTRARVLYSLPTRLARGRENCTCSGSMRQRSIPGANLCICAPGGTPDAWNGSMISDSNADGSPGRRSACEAMPSGKQRLARARAACRRHELLLPFSNFLALSLELLLLCRALSLCQLVLVRLIREARRALENIRPACALLSVPAMVAHRTDARLLTDGDR